MKKGKKIILGLLGAFLVGRTVSVMAAESPELSLKAQHDSSETKIEVHCYMENGKNVTNGKVRIYYDAEKVKLSSDQAGEVLSVGLCEINDCLTGNKPEGELVAAFASAQNVKEEGNLLDMTFEILSGVEKDTEIKFQVKPEKISGDNGDLSVEAAELTFVVGKNGEQVSNAAGSENNGGEQDNTDKKEDNDKKGSSTTDEKSSSSSGTKKSTGKIKTGDDTEIMIYCIIGGGTLLVILLCVAVMIRKKRKG